MNGSGLDDRISIPGSINGIFFCPMSDDYRKIFSQQWVKAAGVIKLTTYLGG
jgi:hypothetical protein